MTDWKMTDEVAGVEWRSTTRANVGYVLHTMSPSSTLLLLATTIMHPAARCLCDNWASCYNCFRVPRWREVCIVTTIFCHLPLLQYRTQIPANSSHPYRPPTSARSLYTAGGLLSTFVPRSLIFPPMEKILRALWLHLAFWILSFFSFFPSAKKHQLGFSDAEALLVWAQCNLFPKAK